jgi:hypothetical protein
MIHPPPARASTRTLAQHEDARDLRAVIVETLSAAAPDERALRNAVWTYVRAERAIGVAPAVVIVELTDMVERAKIAPEATRLERTRGMILWCVEAYFGHLGDDALDASERVAPAGGGAPTDTAR